MLLPFVFLSACRDERPHTIKDLDESMLDLKIYQENMGDELKAGRLQDAAWLLEGMDSILQELNRKYTTHHKMQDPFSYHYRNRLRDPIRQIRSGIRNNDTATALPGYRILVRNCNRCHVDHDIDKTVKL